MMMPSDVPAGPEFADDPARFDAIAEAAIERLARNERVRRNLPGEGRLRIDRQLPFLCMYRSPAGKVDAGTRQLVTTEAAYLFGSGRAEYHRGLDRLCQRIISVMQEHFGTFLILEIWSESVGTAAGSTSAAPAFEVVAAEADAIPSTIDAMSQGLKNINVEGRQATVKTRTVRQVCPPGLRPLSHSCSAGSGGCCVLGVAVRPIYRQSSDGPVFPIILQAVRWQLAGALRRAIAQFTGLESDSDGVHYESLGPSSMVKAARLADQELSEVAESFDFLLQVTPTNSEQAWTEFSADGCSRAPTLYYRPLPYHPSLLKRRLFEIEIERIEDPTLAHIFWEKQEELDRQLTALRDIDTPRFLLTSQQLYGGADDDLVELAEAIFRHGTGDGGSADAGDGSVDAGGSYLSVREFVERARDEIDYYHQKLNEFNASVEVCDSIAAGIMVSRDRLLIAENLRVRPARVEPLLHHEIGTHLLTYFNGRTQPFRQLYTGLAGYEELQEGLAIFAEYLCGGLTTSRMRTLAGRVLAVRSLTEGDTFLQTFQRLHEGYGICPRQAFVTTLRVHRGGGLTKDVIYLRGLRDVLAYLAAGHDMEPLYVGKFGLQHLPFVQELRRRGIIRPPSILPRFWQDEPVRRRLEACRGLTPQDLLETSP
jgi:uncharacterized protein (TIGR02421 family)